VRKLTLDKYTKEQLDELSLIDMAYLILENNNKQTVSFLQIMDEIVAATNLSETEVRARIAQFYTDMNVDGRFLCMGDNRWGLRSWYPVEQAEEDTITQIKPKKKKAKKLKDDDDLDFDDLDDEELDYDDLDEFEEDDLLDDEDESFDLDDTAEEDFEDEDLLDDEEEVFEELEEEVLVDDEDEDEEDDLDIEEDEKL
jgi:DNA-directed RNA polymerase subunit delta